MDAQRQETRVSLYDVELGGTFDQSLFTFIDPKFFGNNRDNGRCGGFVFKTSSVLTIMRA